MKNNITLGKSPDNTLRKIAGQGLAISIFLSVLTLSFVSVVMAATLTNTSVVPATLTAGTYNNVVVSFTTSTNVPVDGKVQVTFPAGFDLSNVTSSDISSSMNGGFTAAVNGQMLTVMRNSTGTIMGGSQNLTVVNNKIRNPANSGQTGSYTVTVLDGSNQILGTDTNVQSSYIGMTTGLFNATVVPSTLAANVNTNVVVTFTTTNNLPANGQVQIVFPSGFNISNVMSSDVTSSLSGNVTSSIRGQTLLISRSGNGNDQSGQITISIGNLKVMNPSSAGQTGAYSVTTLNASNGTIDSNTNVSGNNIIGGISNGSCGGYTDVASNDQDCAAFQYLQSIGVLTGNDNNTLNPNGILQRDEVIKMILENFNNFNSNTNYCSNNNPYPDVTRADWSFQYVCKGTQDQTITGYLSGDDRGYFRPARTVNMAEFSALLLRNLKNVIQPSSSSWSYEDVNVNSWYSGYAKYFQDNNIVTGNFFNPDQGLTRRQAAEIIYKLHQLGKL